MKTAVLLCLLVLVASFMVQDTEAASCYTCKRRCAARGCRYYLCVIRYYRVYCGCYRCGSDTYSKTGETGITDQSREDMMEFPMEETTNN